LLQNFYKKINTFVFEIKFVLPYLHENIDMNMIHDKMENNIIRGAALFYYKENVEGEPLDQGTPIKCFEAGAQFVIDAQKKTK